MTVAPDHVLAAFGLAGVRGEPLLGPAGHVWRHGDAVLKPAKDPVVAAWTAGVFDSLRVTGLRIARPIRSLDGRWVVGGWCAQRYVSGRPSPRNVNTVEVSFVLHDALRDVPRPRFLAHRDDLYGWADRLAWGEVDDVEGRLGAGHGAQTFAALAAGRTPVGLDDQVIHGDLFGSVLFAGSAPPAIVSFNPFWRPATYAAAIVVVDAVAWGGSPMELIDPWAHLAAWHGLVRRAVLFRLALSLTHPRATPESLVRILTVADGLRDVLA